MSSPSADHQARLSGTEVCLLLGIVVLARFVATQWVHVYDDAFITFRYARNWATGVGMTFNPGSPWEPILGTTTPGYTAILAVLQGLGVEAVRAALCWNLAMDAISALILIQLGRGLRSVAGIAVFGFALMPELVRISVGGMESPTLVVLTLACCLFLRDGRHALAGVSTALACTIRPEAVLLVLACGFTLQKDRRGLLRYAVPVVILGLVYAAVLTWYFGDPIPQSVRSKAERHSGSPWLITFGEILKQGLLPRWEYLVFVPFLLLGFRRTVRQDCSLRPLMIFGLAILVAYLGARPHTWGWYYAIPLVGWIIAVAHGMHQLVGTRVQPRHLQAAFRVALPVVAFGIGLFGFFADSRDLVTTQVYQPLEAWARMEGFEGQEHTILASDIGAVGYYAHGKILDTEGLTWPQADSGGEQIAKILEHRPDYILLTAVAAKMWPFFESEEVRGLYEPIKRFSVAGETDLNPHPEDLSRKWMQDYLLFRRKGLK